MEKLCSALMEQIKAHQPHNQSEPISQFHYQLPISLNLLAWLKAQNCYPQFYLNLRDNIHSVACIGEVRSFSDAYVAQKFITESQQEIYLVGGLTFDKSARFWLPRLSLQQNEQNLIVNLYIDNQRPKENEHQACFDAVKTLLKITALEPVQQDISWVAQKADQATWCNWVEQALQSIKQGDFTKVVLANQNQFMVQNILNAKDFLAESEKQNLGCYHFLLAEDEEQAFVGSTPERLYLRCGNLLQTEALAGTAIVTEDEEQNQQQADWLLNDPKNDHENMLVVEDICSNLASYVSKFEVEKVELKKLRRVQHLRRAIYATLMDSANDATCLMAIHPTAAVSGLPQKSAVQFLQKIENFDRSWYAGTLGIMAKERSEFCVTIRSAFIQQNKIQVFAGAGIVEGSIPLLEWQEIERKASGLVSLLKMKE